MTGEKYNIFLKIQYNNRRNRNIIPMKNTIKRSKKGIAILAAVALIGVLLLMIGSRDKDTSGDEVNFESLDPAKYAKEVEERVEELCNRVDGASSAYAVVTLKGGYKAIYASDRQSGSNSSKSDTVLIGSGSGQKALLIGYENPEIAGIGIVCSGGDNYNVRKNIISVVSSAFDISSNKIFVSGS